MNGATGIVFRKDVKFPEDPESRRGSRRNSTAEAGEQKKEEQKEPPKAEETPKGDPKPEAGVPVIEEPEGEKQPLKLEGRTSQDILEAKKEVASTIQSRYILDDSNTDEFGFDKATTLEDSHSISKRSPTPLDFIVLSASLTSSIACSWSPEMYRRRELKWMQMIRETPWNNFLKKNYALVSSTESFFCPLCPLS